MPDVVDNLENYTPEALAEYARDLQDREGVRFDGAALLREVNNTEN